MATITYKSFLMYSEDGTSYQKLLDIKDIPDGIISQKEQVEVTTLSDPERKYTKGIGEGSSDGLTFTCNYDLNDIKTVEGLKDKEMYFAVWFGGTDPTTVGGVATPTGDLGKFGGKGEVDYSINSGGVNDPLEMTVTVTKKSAWIRIEDSSEGA